MITYRLKRFSVSGEYVESSESSVKTINNGKVNYKKSRKHKSGETFTTPEGDVVTVDYPEHKSVKKGSYRLKRYSEDGEKSHTLRNGLLAAGAVTAGVMAGRAGMLGAGVQKSIGTATAWTGNKLGMQSLVKDGATTVGKAARTSGVKQLGGMDAIKGMNRPDKGAALDLIKGQQNTASQGILDKFSVPSKPAPTPTA